MQTQYEEITLSEILLSRANGNLHLASQPGELTAISIDIDCHIKPESIAWAQQTLDSDRQFLLRIDLPPIRVALCRITYLGLTVPYTENSPGHIKFSGHILPAEGDRPSPTH